MNGPFAQTRSVSRRELLSFSMATAAAALASNTALSQTPAASQASGSASAASSSPRDDRRASPVRYNFRKSINQWAFPYPQRMSLRECLEMANRAGFDSI
ncbi:MAG: hypothetical protein ACTHK7_01075, partial [Aureliella sp.]